VRLAALIVVVGVGLAACGDKEESTETSGVVIGNARVERVVDGDTIEVDVDGRDERVRLIGIDTPESVKPESPVECFGPEASKFTESLLPEGTAIRLERDVEARDPFDRLLAYVYRVDDGLFVNLEIVRQGYAQPLTIPPNVAHADDFVDAARNAEADDVGLWAACTG
jgi:micrococcal nuclease